MHNFFDRLSIWWLNKSEAPRIIEIKNQETYIRMLATLCKNSSLQEYLDVREEFLIRKGMEDFLQKKNEEDVNYYAGRITEIRTLRARLRGALIHVNKNTK
jgi:hypothetical protein